MLISRRVAKHQIPTGAGSPIHEISKFRNNYAFTMKTVRKAVKDEANPMPPWQFHQIIQNLRQR